MKRFLMFALLFLSLEYIYSQDAPLYMDTGNIKNIYASSELENKYLAENIIDNSYRSWVEGADGDGTGESFTIEFKSPSRVAGFMLKNEYGQADYYFKNNRVASFEVIIDDNRNGETVLIKDSYEFEWYTLNSPAECTKITFKINNPAASSGVCCSRKVVALRGLILYNRPKGRGIKPLRHE